MRLIKPQSRPFDLRDGLARGLILSVATSGTKVWSIRYEFQGKHRRLALGEFPDVTLAQARDKARAVRIAVRDGRDPFGERQAAKAIPTGTVDALAAAYLQQHATPRKKKNGAEDARVLTVDVLPYLGDRAVKELTRRDIRGVLERVMARDAPYAANRTLEIIRGMLNWGIRHDWLEANPAALIEKPGIEVARERVLDDDEIRALWDLLGRFPARQQMQAPGRPRATVDREGRPFCPISRSLAAVTKFRLLSAQRGGEVLRMRWADLDLAAGWWTIPACDSKNGKPHRVPLTPDMLAVIAAQPKKNFSRPVGINSAPSVYVFTGKASATVEAAVKKAGALLSGVLGFDFRSHDLRRTAATRMAALGVPRDHISQVLNHTPAGAVATRVYDRYNYDAEKRAALSTWNTSLTRLLAGKPSTGARVTPIRARRHA